MGRTRAVYALDLAFLRQPCIVLLSKFRIQDALTVTAEMWSPPLQLVVNDNTQIPEGIYPFKGGVVDAVGE